MSINLKKEKGERCVVLSHLLSLDNRATQKCISFNLKNI
jgi:hypothetical protein